MTRYTVEPDRIIVNDPLTENRAARASWTLILAIVFVGVMLALGFHWRAG